MATTARPEGPVPRFATPVRIVRPVLPSFDEVADGVRSILTSGMVTKGTYLRSFESAVAAHLGVRHAIGVSSCTAGLMLTYRCAELSGDVVVPSFTFMATVSALVWAGLRPVFADVDPGTTTIDHDDVERVLTPQTTAIVAVHNHGNPADIDALQAVADRHGLKLIFDAAHGLGTLYGGSPVGAQGNAHVFSLSPTKLVIAGEGGIVATNDDELAERVRLGREYGNSGRYDSAFAGMNARLAEFNALLGLRSLEKLEEAATNRNRAVELYRRELVSVPGITFMHVRPGNRCSYKDLSIMVDADRFGMTRDQLAARLAEENIETRTYYDPPVHRQTAYAAFGGGQTLPHTNLLAQQCLSLPVWSHMDDDIVISICQVIRASYEARPDR